MPVFYWEGDLIDEYHASLEQQPRIYLPQEVLAVEGIVPAELKMGAGQMVLVHPFQGLLEKAALEFGEGSIPWKLEHCGLH